eukprot:TRINITY_DN5039_c0_g1_i3.p1 TRINITY_DN5039_c0_g1~~TRINITY_DN5039_c0_g1_i3.p1  ORF type:complete len:251 (+),score=93.40 TRINITY_DN5039_c0_g1_i3:85-837(+)
MFDFIPCCVDRQAERQQEASEKAAAMLKAAGKNGDDATKLYDDWADFYDDSLKHWKYPCPEESAKFLKELCEKANKDLGSVRVLDAGCGTGMTGEAMHEAGFEDLVGIDISEASLRKSKSKDVYTDLKPANMDERLEFEDASFDVVMCIGTISYVEMVGDLLQEFVRVCKPGGFVLWTNRADWWKDDKRSVKSVAQQMETDGEWKQVLLTDEMDYLPNNPIKEDAELKIYYVAYQKPELRRETSQSDSVL